MPDLPREVLQGGLWCHEVLERLEAYVDGRLSTNERASVEAHLGSCDICARFGGAYSGMVQSLRRSLADPRPVEGDVARRLEQRIARAMEEK